MTKIQNTETILNVNMVNENVLGIPCLDMRISQMGLLTIQCFRATMRNSPDAPFGAETQSRKQQSRLMMESSSPNQGVNHQPLGLHGEGTVLHRPHIQYIPPDRPLLAFHLSIDKLRWGILQRNCHSHYRPLDRFRDAQFFISQRVKSD